MALIIKGGIINHSIDPPKPKIKRFLAIGPGPSTIDLLSRPLDLDPDIITIGLHRVFPLFTNKTGIKLDYWTWGDPHGAIEGLALYEKMDPKDRPKIIVPHWMRTLSSFSKHCGTSPLTRAPKPQQNQYHRVLDMAENSGDLILLESAVTTKLLSKTHQIFSNPEIRFSGDHVYFNSAPYDHVKSGSNWTSENKFTANILPICHYLGANEVYNIGFDNKGGGISRKQSVSFNEKIKQKYRLWTNTWQPYHNMKIFNLSISKFSPNHTFMETVSIDNLLNK